MEGHNGKSTARKKGTDLFFCCPWRRFWKIASLPIRFSLWGQVLFFAFIHTNAIYTNVLRHGRPRSFYKCSMGNVPDKTLITPDKKVACPFFLC
jgi:hypothetical protein